MNSTCTGLLALLLWSAFPAPLIAQTAPGEGRPIPPGTRVRVTAPTEFRGAVVGRVSHAGGDTLFLARGRKGPVAIPVSAITRTEVSRGVDHWQGVLRGAGTGAVTGAVLFGVLVFASDPNCDYCLRGRDPLAAAAGAVIGAILLTPAGAVVGGIIGTERWVPAESRFGVAWLPHASGLGIRATIRL
ncbi:MAG: hypothetical protein ABW277_17170 [Longimicrobiaceae bacterium]